jgi:hypothetical protein
MPVTTEPLIVDIPWPKSSMPGQKPGEGQGRLINCYCEEDGGSPTWRAMPGLTTFANTGTNGPRGSIVKSGLLFWAAAGSVWTITSNGVVSQVSGTLDGTKPVTWAQNNKSPTSDLVTVTENDAFSVTSSAVTPLGQINLPTPNSVCMLDGYFLFTISDGRVFASDLNDVNVNALSFTTCQADPDGLLRGIVSGPLFYAMGQSSIEIYADAGTAPFPLSRQAVLPVGLAGTWAVAGIGSGWNQGPYFIASDNVTYRIEANTVAPVSSKDFERAVQGITDKSTIRGAAYVVAGNPFVEFSSPSWTWTLNVKTGYWSEGQSQGLTRSRRETAVRFGSKWLVGDTQSGQVPEITESAQDEIGSPLAMRVESGPVKQFPLRLQPYTAWFDWTVGQGALNGTDDAVNPTVQVQISKDGGGTWITTGVHGLGSGAVGEFSKRVRQNRISGTTSQHGLRVANVCSSPVWRSIRGARLTVDPREAA